MKMKWSLFKDHVFPWFWQHSVLIGSGMISSGTNPKVMLNSMPYLMKAWSKTPAKTRRFLRLIDVRKNTSQNLGGMEHLEENADGRMEASL